MRMPWSLCRSVTPSLLKLLQHPVEARRAFAAEYATLLGCHASPRVFSAVLSSSNGLSTLLSRLSGDDNPRSRCCYALLIVLCSDHPSSTPAVLKQISDSGAVPYLLKLLTEADDAGRCKVVACLEVSAHFHFLPFCTFMTCGHACHSFATT